MTDHLKIPESEPAPYIAFSHVSKSFGDLQVLVDVSFEVRRGEMVVVGGMITTLFLTRYLMPVLYSFYGHREPDAGGGQFAH